MKYNILLLAFFLYINFSCAQDLKPLDEENDSSILIEETNYEMELVFEDENIIWSIEFINENSILAAVKSGSIFKYNDGVKTEIKGVPEIYLRGQGGLLDIALHPNFSENNLIYISYASGSRDAGGGNTTISRAKLSYRR